VLANPQTGCSFEDFLFHAEIAPTAGPKISDFAGLLRLLHHRLINGNTLRVTDFSRVSNNWRMKLADAYDPTAS
jgi:hypothetical protein